MNLTDMSVEQLQNLNDQISREIKIRRARDKKEVLLKIRAMAAAGGYTLEELVAGANSLDQTKTVRPISAKYRPNKVDLTWTGRGRQPRWVVEYLATGKSLSDLLIS
jgi:DNA-binding protein H-NS